VELHGSAFNKEIRARKLLVPELLIHLIQKGPTWYIGKCPIECLLLLAYEVCHVHLKMRRYCHAWCIRNYIVSSTMYLGICYTVYGI
jgi:hypothetical protein